MNNCIFDLFIPFRPVSKKNSKNIYKNPKNGRPFITSSDRFKSWEKSVFPILLKAKREFNIECISSYIPLSIHIYLTNRKNELDCTNAAEGIQDLLENVKIIENDKYFNPVIIHKYINAPQDGMRIRIGSIDSKINIEIE